MPPFMAAALPLRFLLSPCQNGALDLHRRQGAHLLNCFPYSCFQQMWVRWFHIPSWQAICVVIVLAVSQQQQHLLVFAALLSRAAGQQLSVRGSWTASKASNHPALPAVHHLLYVAGKA